MKSKLPYKSKVKSVTKPDVTYEAVRTYSCLVMMLLQVVNLLCMLHIMGLI